LPVEENVDESKVQLVYAEEKEDLNNEEKIKTVEKEDVKVDGEKNELTANGLDHFTVFIIKTYSNIELTIAQDTFFRDNGDIVYFQVSGLDLNKFYKIEIDEPDTSSDHWLDQYRNNRTEFNDSYGPFVKNDNLGVWNIRLWESNDSRGNARVEVKNIQFNLVDSPLPNSIKLEQWETQPSGGWVTGNLGSSNSDYKEGETIPFRVDAGKLDILGNPYTFSVCRDFENSTKRGYINLMPQPMKRQVQEDQYLQQADLSLE
jgi:hypothetical protein